MNSDATFRKPKEHTMKVALIGATGKSGQRLQAELLRRGHQVTAVVRSPEKVKAEAGVTTAKSDLSNAPQIAQALKGSSGLYTHFAPRSAYARQFARCCPV
jgi:putative NADH-flavin reductase